MMPDVAPEATIRKLLFEAAGFKVLIADSAKRAIELFKSHRIDAVVMDYWMTPVSGRAAAEEMKKLNWEIPIIILSAWASLPGEIIGKADIWLRKIEIEPDDLVSLVRSLIQKGPPHCPGQEDCS